MHCNLRASCRYTLICVGQAVVTSAIGIPIVVVPFALLLNIAGQALVSSCDVDEGNNGFFPGLWSQETVAAVDGAPYYAFWLVRCMSATLISICLPCLFVIKWTGARALLGWPALAAVIGAIMIPSSIFGEVWLYAEGHVKDPSAHIPLTVHMYVHALVWGFAVMLAAAPAGTRRQCFCPLLKMWMAMSLGHAVFCNILDLYFLGPSFSLQIASLFALMCVRGMCVQAIISGGQGLPGCPEEATTLMAWFMNCFALGLIQVIQTATPDFASLALAFLCCTVSEIGRHVLYLRGTTEIPFMVTILKGVWQRACPRTRAISVIPIDEEGTATSSAELAPGQGKRKILKALVVATNYLEIVVVFAVATMFLLAKFNPRDAVSGPWPVSRTLEAAGMALGFELVGDLCVSTLAWRWESDGLDPYRLDDAQRAQTQALGWNFAMGMVAMLVTLEALVFTTVRLCPWPSPGTNELHVIAPCHM